MPQNMLNAIIHSMNITYRKAEKNDLDQVMKVIRDAQATLKEDGVDQWQDGFPDEKVILEDMSVRSAFVILVDGSVSGFFVLAFDIEPDYVNPVRGAFKNNEPYAAIHRTAISKDCKGKGLSQFMFQSAFDEIKKAGIDYARIDTHHDNKRMRHIMAREGFEETAVIVLSANGDERVAAEKKL